MKNEQGKILLRVRNVKSLFNPRDLLLEYSIIHNDVCIQLWLWQICIILAKSELNIIHL